MRSMTGRQARRERKAKRRSDRASVVAVVREHTTESRTGAAMGGEPGRQTRLQA